MLSVGTLFILNGNNKQTKIERKGFMVEVLSRIVERSQRSMCENVLPAVKHQQEIIFLWSHLRDC